MRIFVLLMSLLSALAVGGATYAVDNTSDNPGLNACTTAGGDCSLRGALANANASPSDDSILFDPAVFSSTQTITLGGTELAVSAAGVSGSLSISGPGSSLLTISGGDGITNTNRVIFVNFGGNLTLSGVTVTRGRVIDDGGAIKVVNGTLSISDSVIVSNTAAATSGGSGGGIAQFGGSLTVNRTTIAQNTAANGGSLGGGVFVNSTNVTVADSTISGNSSFAAAGLRLNGGSFQFTNSTISGNISNGATDPGYAAGIDIAGGLLLTNCTVALNRIVANNASSPGGIKVQGGFAEFRNTIVALNISTNSNKDISNNGLLFTLGNNLIGNNSGSAATFPAGTPNASNDWVGTAASPLKPRLTVLGSRGGPTRTHALFPGSPAIDHGNNCVVNATCPNDPNFPQVTVNNDQRGLARPANGIVDIGATEMQTTESGRSQPPFDFDADGRTDVSIFRPSFAQWWLNRSSVGTIAHTFGSASDILVPGEFTGDLQWDVALFQPSSGTWFVMRSDDNSFYAFPFGASGDVPAPADFDGDGETDAAVFRPSTSTWFIQRSSGGTTITAFGAAGDVPVPADYDGDGRADIAIFRPSLGQWWIDRSTAGIIAVTFGTATDRVFGGDFTGDGRADMAFYRQSTGEWYVLRSDNFAFFAFPFGAAGDLPAPGDFDGDGRFDAAVFRPSTSTWFVQRSSAGVLIQGFGISTDIPLPGVFVR